MCVCILLESLSVAVPVDSDNPTMEEPTVKGTVTPLSSMFPAEDAQRAAKRVEDALSEKQQELNQVKEFIADNSNLINLVQKLPEELHHDIMVPFGEAAFFPGRLIHTNEFLVLLGEGYYADRTSKQTVEILNRRGKALESQVNSIKAMMQDFRAEASFFDATANEAAEGLVEIREEYVEENSSERVSDSGSIKQRSSSFSEADNNNVEDEEYARMMFRLDELEQEELAAEIDNEVDEDNQNQGNTAKSEEIDEDEVYARMMSRLDEFEQEELAAEIDNEVDEDNQGNTAKSDKESDEDEQAITDFDQFSDQIARDQKFTHSEELRSSKPPQQTKDKKTSEDFSNNYRRQQDFSDDQSCTDLTVQAVTRDIVKSSNADKASILPEVKENVGAVPSSKYEVSAESSKPGIDSSKVSAQTSKSGFDIQKAFTGSVVEHTPEIETSTQEQIETSSKPSKLVSRFKMQRR
ncbi:hypothetical protein Ddye_018642 [Dipteronia dyeriana]|uniref:RNA polymerase II subunit 5-mediating protein n=1 Tax=Dipteronia dyeriana TaxID=168575 RepID=A0AAD9X1X0_9ROSI|nr:hypothetical protein Ddye_018642 [Dipteronia dyeriana]